MKMEEVVGAYLKLRNKKEAIEGAVKEEVKAIKEKMVKLEAYIKKEADEQGVTSFKTGSGTAFVTTTDFAQVADWDAILGFIRKNEAWDMLEKRVAKNAIRGYIDEHKEVPNGVNYGTRIDINVRKPVAKVD